MHNSRKFTRENLARLPASSGCGSCTYYVPLCGDLRGSVAFEGFETGTRHGARNVRLFGSEARGEARPDSDIDLLVDMEEGRSLLDLVGLGQDLEDRLSHDYFRADLDLVWTVVVRELPDLHAEARRLLDQLPPTDQLDE